MSARQQLPRFVLVGASAAFVHWSTFSLLVWFVVLPALANLCGFLVAFCVSYLGQRHLTFQVAHIPHRRALPRYFLVSLGSFLVNEVLLMLFLRYTPLSPPMALAFVLVIVAAGTFLLSRHWAFRHHS